LAEALGTAHTRGRGLLRWWWWPVGPKLVFDRMSSPVPEIRTHNRFLLHDRYSKPCFLHYYVFSRVRTEAAALPTSIWEISVWIPVGAPKSLARITFFSVRRDKFKVVLHVRAKTIAPISFPNKSHGKAVGIATGYGLGDSEVGVRVPVISRMFTSPQRPDCLWDPPSLLSNVYRRLFLRG
jgi:hypothetical protein